MSRDLVEGPGGEGRPLLASHHGSADPRYDEYRDEAPDDLEELQRTKAVERRLLWKLDLRMSVLLLIYILNYIDRDSAGAARLRGFEEDLKLDKTQFASILSVFYFGYMLMQIPSNMILVYIGRPSVYLPCCTMLWGIVSFYTGLATSYHGALLARFLLGFVEAGFYPGALFLISRWYRRSEISQRTAYLMCGIFIGEAFGALIASGILNLMNGVLGYAAWRWLFFVEGGLTILVATFALFIIPDFPEAKSVSWLTPEEYQLARRRMVEDSDSSGDSLISTKASTTTFNGFISAVSDWKVWGMAIALYFITLSASFHMYFPTLAATIGFDAGTTMLLCAPPWIYAGAVTLWVSRHSDRTGERCMHIVLPLVVGIIGFLLAMSTMNAIVRYFSLFLMTQTKTGLIGLFAWSAAATSGPVAKRAVAIALVNTLGHCSNIVGAFLWVKEWGPSYNKSFAICTATSLISIAICLFMRMNFRRLNKEMDMDDGLRGQSNSDSEGQAVKSSWRYHT
ncbi:hypothetical protein D9756_002382 [Leucocoprinus leucothites]|uniref:Major facilitator superfamily (MFS) profile domain-containing protein n=1 Tax=Leucocoprinus leucothites TaxID=201217 RepID=A0A8H5LLT8_9AGAR|nr:hypothetical protein D9756_002382 [Leucoagaricus leucothites]